MKSILEQISWYLDNYGVPIVIFIMAIIIMLNNYVWS